MPPQGEVEEGDVEDDDVARMDLHGSVKGGAGGWTSDGVTDGDVTDLTTTDMGGTESTTPSPIGPGVGVGVQGGKQNGEEDERFRAYLMNESSDDAGEDVVVPPTTAPHPAFLRRKVADEDDDMTGTTMNDGAGAGGVDAATEAVKEAVRGVYKLWLASKRTKALGVEDDGGGGVGRVGMGGGKEDLDGAEFMRVVREAIAKS